MSTFGTARLENGPDLVRGRAQLFTFEGEQVTVRASLDKLMKLCRCCMALFQRASSFVTGSARCHGQLPIAHPAFASSRAWLADSCGMHKTCRIHIELSGEAVTWHAHGHNSNSFWAMRKC